MRVIPAAAVAAVAAIVAAPIVTAGCAGAQARGLGSADGAASVVPSNAVLFVAASTDVSSAQWHGIGEVLLQQLGRQSKLTWADDLKPALGDELDVAVLPGKEPEVVAFTQPHDRGKLDALAAKYSLQTRDVGGWTAVAKDTAALDAVANATTTLAQSNLFGEAMNELPSGALARAYANGGEAEQLIASLSGSAQTGAPDYRWAAAALVGSAHGLKLEGVARAAGDAQHQLVPYSAALLDRVPAGVLAVADFSIPPNGFGSAGTMPPQLEKLLGPIGSSLPSQLGAILGGETAIYVRPGLPIPEVTLVTRPADVDAAVKALEGLVGGLPKPFGGLTLHHATVGNDLVVSTSPGGIDDFRGAGPKLASDATFLEAKKLSGMPDQTTGFAYVNVKNVLPLLQLAGAAPPQGLPDLRTLAVYGGRAGADSRFTAFLEVGSS